ncbi:rhomboid family intramembrane serine protease [Frigidibacter oleivorans]|uniref:rhomboid family intramembrane serine protease n=1 Tax=Frigidibacter oleivorans TaxID=2487129 RepID=UPI000F8CEDDC|nr:rhomboid family intramembrane serine protease [Frigidibacter oleivorans]
MKIRAVNGPGAASLPAALPLWLLCALCVAIEALLTAADHGLIGSARWRPMAYQYGGFWSGLIRGGWQPNFAAQPVTMFATYALLHAGPGHLLGNVVTLRLLMPEIALRFGRRAILTLWALSQLGGGLGFAALNRGAAPMVGASGIVFGFLAALVAARLAGRPGRQWLRGLAGAAAGFVALNAAMWLLLGGRIAWETHLGGALAGLAAGWLMARRG